MVNMTKPDISLSYLILTGLFITAVIQITLDETECPVCIECPILETKIEEIDEKNNLTQQQSQQQPQQQCTTTTMHNKCNNNKCNNNKFHQKKYKNNLCNNNVKLEI
jgi:2-succinyl-5-enolpyruvyl-6-hydroxy-3-cyclohexene-1-carboxylate synthase